jgi:putative sigma-54 modulation protein
MTVEIRSHQIAPTAAMRDFVNRQATNILGRFGGAVQSATLRVQDVNGPRGGHDKQCLLALSGSRLGLLVIKATDANFYTAVTRVMKRANEAVRRTLGRQRTEVRTAASRPRRSAAAPSRRP